MSNPRENLDKPQQGEPDTALRRLLNQMIRSCRLSRPEICEALTRRLGMTITPFMLDSYTAGSKKPARFPAIFVGAFCQVTGDDRLRRFFMTPRDLKLIRFAERELAAAKDARERQRVAARLLRENPGAGKDS